MCIFIFIYINIHTYDSLHLILPPAQTSYLVVTSFSKNYRSAIKFYEISPNFSFHFTFFILASEMF